MKFISHMKKIISIGLSSLFFSGCAVVQGRDHSTMKKISSWVTSVGLVAEPVLISIDGVTFAKKVRGHEHDGFLGKASMGLHHMYFALSGKHETDEKGNQISNVFPTFNLIIGGVTATSGIINTIFTQLSE